MTLLIMITNIMNTRQNCYTYEAQRTGRLEIQCGTFLEVKADSYKRRKGIFLCESSCGIGLTVVGEWVISSSTQPNG